MFRHEKPQKGRYRQFNQIDVEAIGFAGPDVDVELIALTARLWQHARHHARASCRSIRSARPSRARPTATLLQDYFRQHRGALDADSKRRLEGNPLRILDSKTSADAGDRRRTRRCSPSTSTPSRSAHFAELRAGLDALGIAYTVNPRLVRGLDYYSARCSSGSPTRSAARTPSAPAAATTA